MSKVEVELDEQTIAYLKALTRSSAMGGTESKATIADVLAYLAHSASDGLRRPGAWERGWVEQAFGDFPEGAQTPGVHYAHREPWVQPHITHVDVDTWPECEICGCGVEVQLSDETSGCLACLTKLGADLGLGLADELALEPVEVALAWLLAFAVRAFTERDERPRCGECGAPLREGREHTCRELTPEELANAERVRLILEGAVKGDDE